MAVYGWNGVKWLYYYDADYHDNNDDDDDDKDDDDKDDDDDGDDDDCDDDDDDDDNDDEKDSIRWHYDIFDCLFCFSFLAWLMLAMCWLVFTVSINIIPVENQNIKSSLHTPSLSENVVAKILQQFRFNVSELHAS